MRLANELGLILTKNEDGDIVIEEASMIEEPPLWQNFTKRIDGDTEHNNITSMSINRDRTQIYHKYYKTIFGKICLKND